MKTTLAIAAALAMLAAPARADQLPTDAEYQAATDKAVASYIAAKGWCARTKPAPKTGQVVIYYVRDKSGKCVATFAQGK